eukprot:243697-Ditylum_brightwellii.AAC.1
MLTRDLDVSKFDGKVHYRQAIGKLIYFEKGSSGDINFAMHQCARLCKILRDSHAAVVEHIVPYPRKNKDNWFKKAVMDDASTAKSRIGYIITYAGCPILWTSELQPLVTLIPTEAEHVAISTAAREAI